MRINVSVRRGEKRISETPDGIEVFTTEPMENNRANLDVIKQIAKKYAVSTANVRIVSGSSKRKKIIEIEK